MKFLKFLILVGAFACQIAAYSLCRCTRDGVSNGVQTNATGCGFHYGSSLTQPTCFVVDPLHCPNAVQAKPYRDAYYMPCAVKHALFFAARTDNVEMLLRLRKSGQPLNVSRVMPSGPLVGKELTLVSYAAAYGSFYAVEDLLISGDYECGRGLSPREAICRLSDSKRCRRKDLRRTSIKLLIDHIYNSTCFGVKASPGPSTFQRPLVAQRPCSATPIAVHEPPSEIEAVPEEKPDTVIEEAEDEGAIGEVEAEETVEEIEVGEAIGEDRDVVMIAEGSKTTEVVDEVREDEAVETAKKESEVVVIEEGIEETVEEAEAFGTHTVEAVEETVEEAEAFGTHTVEAVEETVEEAEAFESHAVGEAEAFESHTVEAVEETVEEAGESGRGKRKAQAEKKPPKAAKSSSKKKSRKPSKTAKPKSTKQFCNRYPFFVSVRTPHDRGYQHLCGGVLIAKDIVLTVAHCLERIRGEYLPFVAIQAQSALEEQSSCDSKAEIRKTRKIEIHPEWKGGRYPRAFGNGRDAALIFLDKDSKKTPIDIATSGSVKDGTELIFMGVGRTTQNSGFDPTLHVVSLSTVSAKSCRAEYNMRFSPNVFCTKAASEYCVGDEGGPIVFQSSSEPTLMGIAHMKNTDDVCGHPDFPSVFVNAPRLKKWIDKKRKEHKQSPTLWAT